MAAGQLELADTTAEEEDADYAPYCYYLGFNEALYFNHNVSSTISCSTDDLCICKSDGTPSPYSVLASGSSCKRITSKADCDLAAGQLGLDDTTAVEKDESDYPPYCFYDTYNEILIFNNNGDSTLECSGEDLCICRNDGK